MARSTRLGQGAFSNDDANGDVFIAAFDASGQPKWAHALTDPDPRTFPSVSGLEIDAQGNVALAGTLGNGFSIGDEAVVYGEGGAWLVQLDRCGTLLWSKSGRSCEACGAAPGPFSPLDLHAEDDDLWASGWLAGGGYWLHDRLVAGGYHDGFVAKIDGSGARVREPDGALPICGTNLEVQTVTIELEGTGAGRVTSDPPGIDCPGACDASFESLAQVTLTAEPEPGSSFVGYGGACSGFDCTLTISDDAVVTARFDRPALIWQGAFGNTGNENPIGHSVGPGGELVWFGMVTGPYDVGLGPVADTFGSELALVGLDAGGVPSWAHVAYYGGFCFLDAIAHAPNGDLVITGTATEPIDFGGGPLPLTQTQQRFVTRLAGDGTHLWSRVYDARGDTVTALAAGADHLVLGGYQGASGTWGALTLGAGEEFVVVLDSVGEPVWARALDGVTVAAADAVGSAGALIAGPATGGAFVDLGEGPTTQSTGFVVARLDGTGLVWSMGDDVTGGALAAASGGRAAVHISGSGFGDVTLGGLTEPLDGNDLVAVIDASGTVLSLGGLDPSANWIEVRALALAPDGSLSATGRWTGDVQGVPVIEDSLFRLAPDGTLAWRRAFDPSWQGLPGTELAAGDTATALMGATNTPIDLGPGPLQASPGGGWDAWFVVFGP